MTGVERSLLTVRSGESTIGLAFLVTDSLALTCSHVVNLALQTERTVDETGSRIEVVPTFRESGPSGGDIAMTAVVERWSSKEQPRRANDDIAVLRLERPFAGCAPVALGTPEDTADRPVRAFGMPAGYPDGVWHEGTLRGVVGSGWIQLNQTGEPGYRVVRGFSGTPLWDEQLQAVVGMITVADVEGVPAAFAIPATALEDAVPKAGAQRTVPFPGLSPYTEAMRGEFLARDQDATAIVSKLRDRRSTTILGPSGSGKSSLALAGVVPRMRDAGYDVVVTRPSDDLVVLRTSIADHIVNGAGRNKDARLLVVVDQLEEAFHLSDGDRAHLTNALAEVAEAGGVRVLATLRPDFLGLVQADEVLRDLVATENVYPLGPLDEAGLRDVVERVGAPGSRPVYAGGLVDRIVADAMKGAAPMPMLSHALKKLWQAKPGGTMTHQAYREIGGVPGALQQAIDVWLDNVPPRVEKHLPELFTALVRHMPETNTWTRQSERIADLDEPEHELARGLTTAGVLVVSGGTHSTCTGGEDVHVELAHDALFDLWKRLRDFIAENRAFLVWHGQLHSDAERWAREGRRAETLPTRAELALAERWTGAYADRITPVQSEFLAEGRARQARRRRWQRLALVGAVSVLVMVVAAAVVIAKARDLSADQQRLADSRIFAEQAREIERSDSSLGILAAVAAWDTARTKEARDRLLAQYVTYRGYDRLVPPGLGGQRDVAYSADGDVVVTVSNLGRLTVHTGVLSGLIRSEHATERSYVRDVDISADGRRVVGFDEEGHGFWFAVRPDMPGWHGPVHDLQDATEVVPGFVPQVTGSPNSTVSGTGFSDDGGSYTGWAGDYFIRWDLATGDAVDHASPPPEVRLSLGVNPTGDGVIAMRMNNPKSAVSDVIEFDISTGKTRKLTGEGNNWLLSGDRKWLVACRKEAESVVLERFRVADGVRMSHVTIAEDAPPSCQLNGVDREGRWVTKSTDVDGVGSNGRVVVDMEKGRVVARDVVPGGRMGAGGMLVERDGHYYDVVYRPFSGSSLGYIELPMSDDVAHEFIDHVLLDDDRRILTLRFAGDPDDLSYNVDGSVTAHGERQYVLEVRSEDLPGHVLATAETSAANWQWRSSDGIRLSADRQTIAIRDGLDKVVLRDTSLRKRLTVTTAKPAVSDRNAERPATRDLLGQAGLTESFAGADGFAYFFDAGNDLVTVSDNVVQLWDGTNAKEIGRFNAAGLFPDLEERAFPGVVPTAEPGNVAIMLPGTAGTYVVNIVEGRTVDELPTGPDVSSVQFDPSGQFLAIQDAQNSVEVVDADTMDRVLGPLSVDESESLTDSNIGNGSHLARFLPGDRFLLATSGQVETFDLVGENPAESNSFRIPDDGSGTVPDVAADGKSVIYHPQYRAAAVIRLDPTAWRSELCSVTGRRVLRDGELKHLIDTTGPLDICTNGAGT